MLNRRGVIDWDQFRRISSHLGPRCVAAVSHFRCEALQLVETIERAGGSHNAFAMIAPAQTLESEARQLGANQLAHIADRIATSAYLSIHRHRFEDDLAGLIAELRQLAMETLRQFADFTNPLARHIGSGGFGRRRTDLSGHAA